MAKVSATEAAQALRDSKGFITTAAKRLGISRMQLHRLINAHPTVKEALDDAREAMKDFTEGKLHEGITNGNPTLIIFYLKTQARDRGYIERQEIDHSGGMKIEVKYGDRNGQPEATPSETD